MSNPLWKLQDQDPLELLRAMLDYKKLGSKKTQCVWQSHRLSPRGTSQLRVVGARLPSSEPELTMEVSHLHTAPRTPALLTELSDPLTCYICAHSG